MKGYFFLVWQVHFNLIVSSVGIQKCQTFIECYYINKLMMYEKGNNHLGRLH